MSQHAELTLERWRAFDRDQQVLMIANEMHRAGRQREPEALWRAYERVLRLADLTAGSDHRLPFRREILRWRDGVAELYLTAAEEVGRVVDGAPGGLLAGGSRDEERHLSLLHALLLLSPLAARQRPYILG